VRVWPEIIDGVRLNCSRRTVKLPGILHPLTIFRTLNRARRLSFNYSSCPRPLRRGTIRIGEGRAARVKSRERLICVMYTPGAGSSDDRPMSFVGRVVFFPLIFAAHPLFCRIGIALGGRRDAQSVNQRRF